MGSFPWSTFIPGIIPSLFRTSANFLPSAVDCRIVSSNKITPLINSPMPGVVNNIWRYALRLFSVDSSEIFSNRFFIVEVLSSAAKMPFPGATNCLAIDLSFSMSIDLFE